jgi:hypothetical protein
MRDVQSSFRAVWRYSANCSNCDRQLTALAIKVT